VGTAESQAHIAPEREPTDIGFLDIQMAQELIYVFDAVFPGII